MECRTGAAVDGSAALPRRRYAEMQERGQADPRATRESESLQEPFFHFAPFTGRSLPFAALQTPPSQREASGTAAGLAKETGCWGAENVPHRRRNEHEGRPDVSQQSTTICPQRPKQGERGQCS
jgi:hypothetical protein